MTTDRRWFRRLTGALALFALTLAGCSSKSTEPVVPPVSVPLSSLTVSPHADTIVVSGQVQLAVTALDTLGALVGNPSVSWSTGDAAIAQVSGGLVSGRGEGSAWVFAASGGQRDSARITVIGSPGWTLQPGNALGSNLAGIHFLPDGRHGWAVGSAGRIVSTSDAGAHWSTEISSTSFNLNAVWFPTSQIGIAVGNAGTVMRSTDGGASWARVLTVTTSENLYDTRFIDGTHGWAVGSNGIVLRTTDGGQDWTKTILPTSFALHSVAFANVLDGWAVGDGGTVYGTHDGGVSWYPVSLATSSSLRGVSRWDLTHTLAVGQVGTVGVTFAGPDSALWALPVPNAGASNQLEKCQLVSAGAGYAVGYNAGVGGVVLYTDDGGLNWRSQVSNTSVRLNAVFFVDALRGWAVGDGGVILHTGNGGFGP